MSYEMYRYIFIGAAILSGLMLIASIIVFILLKIPKVVSDLSGATARKAIKNIREQNEASGDKGYKVSAFNEARGKLTDKISASGNLMQRYQMQMGGIDTSKISAQDLPVDEAANQTMLLDSDMEYNGMNETSVLSEAMPYGETSVLDEAMGNVMFVIEYEITYIHTDEVIPVEAFG